MENVSQKVVIPEGKTRLMITKMILENFKSYAGAQEIGPFHKRFSSVVGPNGSGKSNVIDALLFVFGKRAKQLRLNKVSELIHKSSGFPNLEYAKVAVHFQLIYDDEESADDFEIVPGSEFIVSRTADLKNQSKYTVDGKGSTYTEVGLLLRKHGIDLDNNRFLILQGEVEQIAMMKPKAQNEHEEGLLEYLEDIIGSNKFAERIEEAGKALEVLNEKRVEKVNRLRSADKEREELVEEKDKVEKRRQQEQQIRERQSVLYQLEESLALSKVKHYVVEKEKAQALLELESSKKKEGEEELLSLEKAYSTKKAEYDAVKKELDNAQANFAAYERKDTELQENISHSRVQIDKFKGAVSRDLRKEEECLREAEEALLTVTTSRAKLAETEANKLAEDLLLEGILEGLKEATQGLRDNLEGAQAQLADAERATATIQTEKESAETGLQLLKARSTAAVLAVSTTEDKIRISGAEVENLEEKKATLEQEKVNLNRRVQAMEAQVLKAQDEETVLHTSLKQSLTSLEDAKASLLSQQNSTGKGKNKVLDMLMAATKKGGPLQSVGLRGRLGDLGTIDPEYDVAISTCCGMLDYMVVDTVVDGQRCINYIRENNIGRANFLVLEQTGQHKGGMDRFLAVKVPEGAKRMIDLVTPSDPSLQLVFYMAVRDTLVSKDLESAVAIAYQGGKAMWRVVTADGNLIDISGSMSGGGKSAKSGGMLLSGTSTVRVNAADVDQTVTPEQVSILEAKVTQCEAALAACRLNKKNSSTSAKESVTRIKTIEIELEKLDMEINRIKGQIIALTSRLDELRKAVQLSPSEIKDMEVFEVRITKLDEDIAKASPDKVTLKRSVEAIKRQIKAEGGPKLARAQAKVDSLVAQLQILNKTTSTKEVDEKTHRKQALKVAESRAKGEMDLSKATTKLAAYQAELSEMEEDAITLMQAQDAAVHSEVVQGEQLHTLDVSHSALQKTIKKLRETETKLTDEYEKAEHQLKLKSVEASSWRTKLESVRAQHTEEQVEYYADVNEVLASIRKNIESSSSSATSSTSAIEEEQKIEILPDLSPENLESEKDDLEEIKREIELLEKARNRQNSGDRSALMDWIKKDRLYRFKLSELEAVTLERNTVRKEYESLRGQRLEMFMGGFGIITLKLKEMYQMITLGGDAELELLDSLDPFSEGIVFSVRPPKKSWKNISNLSGGEKTLSSLALVFALHHYKPTPLYVMDEIDAALDFKNVSIVANYIKERTKNAQFVIISLRNNMFELADRLVGIYKTHDATKSVTINPRMFAEATTNKSKLLASAGKEKEKKGGDGGEKERGKVILGDATNRMT